MMGKKKRLGLPILLLLITMSLDVMIGMMHIGRHATKKQMQEWYMHSYFASVFESNVK